MLGRAFHGYTINGRAKGGFRRLLLTMRLGMGIAIAGLLGTLLIPIGEAAISSDARVSTDGYLPSGRHGAGAVWDSVRHVVYIFGGFDEKLQTDTAEILEFDPASSARNATLIGHLPGPMSGLVAVWTGEVAYIVGGDSDAIMQFDPATATLTVLSVRLPHTVDSPAAVWTGRAMYLFGGTSDSSTPVGTIMRFEPDEMTASTLEETLPRAGHYAAVWSGDGTAYILGGGGNEIYAFTPNHAPSLVQLNVTLPLAIDAAGAVWDGTAVLVFGGREADGSPNGGTALDTVIRFDPQAPPSQSVSYWPNLPVPGTELRGVPRPCDSAFLLGGKWQTASLYDAISRYGPPQSTPGDCLGPKKSDPQSDPQSASAKVLQADFTWHSKPVKCGPRSVSFTDTSTPGDAPIVSWGWDFGDGSQSAEQNPQHTYANSGTYTVRETVTDSAGSTSTYETTVYAPANKECIEKTSPSSTQHGARPPRDGNGEASGDADGDGISDSDDDCPFTADPEQLDADGDGIGDVCDDDADNDGIRNVVDNCPVVPNRAQTDFDADGLGDVCDPDADGDTVANEVDNCLQMANADQLDSDANGIGDSCDFKQSNLSNEASQPRPISRARGVASVGRETSANGAIPLAIGIAILLAIIVAATCWRIAQANARGPTVSKTKTPPVVLLFSRIGDADLLKHPIRKHLVQIIHEKPGITFIELVAASGKGRGTIEHHLATLQAGRIIQAERSGRFLCYYARPLKPHDAERTVALRSALAQAVARLAIRRPGTTMYEASRQLGADYTAIKYHARRLAAAGIISVTPDNRLHGGAWHIHNDTRT